MLAAALCAVLCAAIVYAPKPTDPGSPIDVEVMPPRLRNRARKRVREFRRAEAATGIEQMQKPLDFGLTGPLVDWFNGEPFAVVAAGTSMQEGDLVRSLRLTIQVLRQLAWSLPADHHVAQTCRTAIEVINRDEVDAEAQLRVI